MRTPSSGHCVELGRGFLFQTGLKIDFGLSPTLVITAGRDGGSYFVSFSHRESRMIQKDMQHLS